MIPWLLILKVHPREWRFALRLWIPLFLIWILLLPFVLILAPFALVACLFVGVRPFRAVKLCWNFLVSFRGLHVEVRDEDVDLKIAIC